MYWKISNLSEGILEAAALTVGDNEDNIVAWVEIFEKEINNLLPEGVWINLGTCKQEGDLEKMVSDYDYEGLLSMAEQKTDEIWDSRR